MTGTVLIPENQAHAQPGSSSDERAVAPRRWLGGGAGGSCLSIDAKTVREYRRLYRCAGTGLHRTAGLRMQRVSPNAGPTQNLQADLDARLYVMTNSIRGRIYLRLTDGRAVYQVF